MKLYGTITLACPNELVLTNTNIKENLISGVVRLLDAKGAGYYSMQSNSGANWVSDGVIITDLFLNGTSLDVRLAIVPDHISGATIYPNSSYEVVRGVSLTLI